MSRIKYPDARPTERQLAKLRSLGVREFHGNRRQASEEIRRCLNAQLRNQLGIIIHNGEAG